MSADISVTLKYYETIQTTLPMLMLLHSSSSQVLYVNTIALIFIWVLNILRPIVDETFSHIMVFSQNVGTQNTEKYQ